MRPGSEQQTTEGESKGHTVKIRGIGASAGVAIGPALVIRPQRAAERRQISAGDVPAELDRLQQALGWVKEELTAARKQAERQAGEQQAAIFDAQLLMLEDPQLQGRAEELIREQLVGAEWAVQTAAQEAAAVLAALPDEYLRARAGDVLDVGRRVVAALTAHGSIALTAPAIVVSDELGPADTVQMDRNLLLGFVMEGGSHSSHVAILARTMGIPAIVGAPGVLGAVRDGDALVVDGEEGTVTIRPRAEDLEAGRRRQQDWVQRQERLGELLQLPAVTKDGHRVELAANIGSSRDVAAALAHGAEGVGLFRTEFLFMDRTEPGEEEQWQHYRTVAEAMGGRPVIVRTLDIGGDKPIAWLNLPREDNPFLGHRGIRLCLDRRDLFLAQLRALLRARSAGNIWVMFPMVADVGEVRAARQAMEEAHRQLAARGIPHEHSLPVGIMVEVPSAAVMADVLYREVDFVSIGTNDLTQYTLAADRTNPQVAGLWDALHPAVLRLIARVAEAARQHGKWVGVCGDLGGDPLAAPALVGLGLHELSMAPAAIPAVKEAIRAVSLPQAQELARACLNCATAAEVRRLLAH